MSEVKFCKDCQFAIRDAEGKVVRESLCSHPASKWYSVDRVTGEVRHLAQRSCGNMRDEWLMFAGVDRQPDHCGPEAKFFREF